PSQRSVGLNGSNRSAQTLARILARSRAGKTILPPSFGNRDSRRGWDRGGQRPEKWVAGVRSSSGASLPWVRRLTRAWGPGSSQPVRRAARPSPPQQGESRQAVSTNQGSKVMFRITWTMVALAGLVSVLGHTDGALAQQRQQGQYVAQYAFKISYVFP